MAVRRSLSVLKMTRKLLRTEKAGLGRYNAFQTRENIVGYRIWVPDKSAYTTERNEAATTLMFQDYTHDQSRNHRSVGETG